MREGASDAELTQLISDTWTRRTDRYSEVRSTLKNSEQPLRKIEMYYIGG
jgi:GTP 3',8-cyclase